MHSLEVKISAAKAAGKPALVPFLTAGFPDRSSFWPTMVELDENGADIIEIGVPFSDPCADGPVIEAASKEVLQQGVCVRDIMHGLMDRKGLFSADLVLMGYYNPFYQYGLEKVAREAKEGGVTGFIVPDLPLEESEPMRSALRKEGIALITLVGPNTSLERMKEYAACSEGYVYVVSVMGVTGARNSFPPELEETLLRAREAFSLPIALGFGLQDPKQLAGLSEKARPDAVIFGSALIRALSDGQSAADFLARWR
ncbi:MAG: tryptophan synthase subunit alpha [Desulfovibrio sp.]|nr:tryptophan synthase subunit alpha [Desulfovibrio sp.]